MRHVADHGHRLVVVLARQRDDARADGGDQLVQAREVLGGRVGVVAEVTTVTSSVGCNIQSIEIDHVTEDSAVLSLVLTDEGDIGQLSAQLINAGFSVSFSPLTAKEHTHVA